MSSRQNPNPRSGGQNTLWQGRLGSGSADALRVFNDSLSYDQRMFREDIEGSRAHVKMLAFVGLITCDERDTIVDALNQVETELAAELESGSFKPEVGDEDIHTVVERRVTEITSAGAKMHTGRSRNDQVVTDLRLWVKTALKEIAEMVLDLQHVILDKAVEAGDAHMPGYTHLQQAQTIFLAHHLLAHGWALSRDVDRLLEAKRRADVSPLGAGALAGSSLPIDTEFTATQLGFSAVFENSVDVVSDRDFVVDTLYALAVLGVHLSRIGEEFVLWSTSEFAFVELDDRYATGSSMMPQKKNPDIAELARGKSGRLIGHLTGLLATLKGLPLAYAKDLQEDKEHLFDAVDTVKLTLNAMNGMLATARFDISRMSDAASSPYIAATDLAEWLVANGTPFREAHTIVSGLVKESLQVNSTITSEFSASSEFSGGAVSSGGSGFSAGAVSPGEMLVRLVRAHPLLGTEAARLLQPRISVSRRFAHGAHSSNDTCGVDGMDNVDGMRSVEIQIERFEKRLNADAAHVMATRK